MKAISILNPHAHHISTGEKSIEVRSWSTDHRGPLLVCTSRGWDRGNMTRDEARQTIYKYGVALVVVDLVDVRELREDDTHHSLIAFRKDHYAWVLARPRPLLKPFPVTGRLMLYDVPDLQVALGNPQEAPCRI